MAFMWGVIRTILVVGILAGILKILIKINDNDGAAAIANVLSSIGPGGMVGGIVVLMLIAAFLG